MENDKNRGKRYPAVKVQTQNRKKGDQDQHAKSGHEGVEKVMIL